MGEIPFDKKEITSELFATPIKGEHIIGKASHNAGERLISLLKEMKIDTVYVCGLITSICVNHTAYGLFEAGFKTSIVYDCCADRGL